MNKRTELPTAENSSNFNRVAGATCQVGTTLRRDGRFRQVRRLRQACQGEGL